MDPKIMMSSYNFYNTHYRIVGKFCRENVWRIISFQAFGKKRFGE